MSKELEAFIQEYMNVTLEIMEYLSKDNFELQTCFDRRQNLIENIESVNYSNDEFTKLIKKYNILNLEEELRSVMQEKKEQIQREMKRLQISRNANTNYNKKYTQNSIYFNKKI